MQSLSLAASPHPSSLRATLGAPLVSPSTQLRLPPSHEATLSPEDHHPVAFFLRLPADADLRPLNGGESRANPENVLWRVKGNEGWKAAALRMDARLSFYRRQHPLRLMFRTVPYATFTRASLAGVLLRGYHFSRTGTQV